ncbi:hypothetical protein GWK48_03640 [Metallosphaera tengchongensis]|uniref:Uncharacterized protein n=2 Tax=Metallosphaera tengchongensis TaxID=1532350 RepID=A0A6N0P143_9CREN|nr:hypothetical protein GWK48_03640 [Metallosphaera tengchongensis]
MFEIWYISIGLSIFAGLLSAIILAEFARLRSTFGGRILLIFTALAILMVAQNVTYSFSFMMWSNDRNPIYVYPSLTMAIIDAIIISILFYYTIKY